MKSSSENGGRRPLGRALACLALLGVAVAVAGCGSGGLAPVKGKVTFKGEPVKGGTLSFSPVAAGEEKTPGKPASAEVQPDGTFTAGTNSASDGVKVGKARVTFSPPAVQLTEEQKTNPKYVAPPPPYRGLAPKAGEVEIKAGANDLEIELVPKR